MDRSETIQLRLRTITLGIGTPHPLDEATFRLAGPLLRMAQAEFEKAGYQVESARLALRPLFVDLASWSANDLLAYCADLHQLCTAEKIRYCSIGHVPADARDLHLGRISLLSQIVAANPTLSASVQIASTAVGLRAEAALPAARVILDLAQTTHEGLGNLFFAVTANTPQHTPYFPVACHRSPDWGFSIGLQLTGVVNEVLRSIVHEQGRGMLALRDGAITARLIACLEEIGRPIAERCEEWREHDLTYFGLDLSVIPYGQESIAAAIEQVGLGQFGEPGTLAVASAISTALKGTSLRTCGYCGLALPVLSDPIIGRRVAERKLSLESFLLYSAISGTGLSSIPIPGDTPPERIASILLDVGALATRLRKPLTAQLLPVPGKKAGEMTNYTLPYLINTRIMEV